MDKNIKIEEIIGELVDDIDTYELSVVDSQLPSLRYLMLYAKYTYNIMKLLIYGEENKSIREKNWKIIEDLEVNGFPIDAHDSETETRAKLEEYINKIKCKGKYN